MTKSVSMIEYQGRVDENGKALGHGPKVLNDYFELIREYCNVSVYAPLEILKEFKGCKEAISTKVLPDRIVMGKDKTIIIKIANKFNMFRNIERALKDTDAEILWFFNVEFYFFLYIFMHKRIKRKIICTMFLDGYRGGLIAKLKQFIFEQAQKKIDFIIATGKQLKFKNCKYEYVPDYFYDEEKFAKYKGIDKTQLAVCLGTMGKGKQLHEMVEAFNRIDYPLIVAGRFYDKELLKSLKEKANSNIKIRDEYLSNEEYMYLLSKATYTVLPYGKDKYDHQTSGVMQEAIFLNTIPISYNEVLEKNDVVGVGFNSWNELKIDLDEKSILEFTRIYEKKRKGEYSLSSVRNFYKGVFE